MVVKVVGHLRCLLSAFYQGGPQHLVEFDPRAITTDHSELVPLPIDFNVIRGRVGRLGASRGVQYGEV